MFCGGDVREGAAEGVYLAVAECGKVRGEGDVLRAEATEPGGDGGVFTLPGVAVGLGLHEAAGEAHEGGVGEEDEQGAHLSGVAAVPKGVEVALWGAGSGSLTAA